MHKKANFALSFLMSLLFIFSSPCFSQSNLSSSKSESTALQWSLFGTLVPLAAGVGLAAAVSGPDENPVPPLVLMGSGLIIGPSLGYFYGGRSNRGMQGIAIRLGMEAVFVTTAGIAVEKVGTSTLEDFSSIVAAVVILTVGQVFVLAHGIYDIANVKSEVRKYNQSLKKTNLMVMPKYFAQSKVPGVQLQISFQ